MSLIERRLQSPGERPDFLTRMLEHGEGKDLSKLQLAAHASDFVIAGSETTATTLSTITFYLFHNPRIFQLLRTEIHGSFKKYEEINASSTSSLTYMNAVILEAMRIYASLPLGLPRLIPEGGDVVDGHFLPAGIVVSTSPVAAALSAKNFQDPFEFRPERWLGKNDQDVLDAVQPFSVGTRACL